MGQQIVTAQIAGGAGGLRQQTLTTDDPQGNTAYCMSFYYAPTAQTVSYKVTGTADGVVILKSTAANPTIFNQTVANPAADGATGSTSLEAGAALRIAGTGVPNKYMIVHVTQTA